MIPFHIILLNNSFFIKTIKEEEGKRIMKKTEMLKKIMNIKEF